MLLRVSSCLKLISTRQSLSFKLPTDARDRNQLDLVQILVYPAPVPAFTVEAARAAGQKSAKARLTRAAALKALQAQVAQPDPEPVQPEAAQPSNKDDGLARRRLAKVETEIDRVHDKLDKENDPSKLERLSRALIALYELDTQLRRPASADSKGRLSRTAQREQSRPDVGGFEDSPPV